MLVSVWLFPKRNLTALLLSRTLVLTWGSSCSMKRCRRTSPITHLLAPVSSRASTGRMERSAQIKAWWAGNVSKRQRSGCSVGPVKRHAVLDSSSGLILLGVLGANREARLPRRARNTVAPGHVWRLRALGSLWMLRASGYKGMAHNTPLLNKRLQNLVKPIHDGLSHAGGRLLRTTGLEAGALRLPMTSLAAVATIGFQKKRFALGSTLSLLNPFRPLRSLWLLWT